MRLQVTQGPKRRKFGIARDARVFGHDRGRIVRAHHEDVERQPFAGGIESALGAGEIKGTERLVDEHGPAVRANQPLNGNAPAMRPQLVPALSAAHGVRGAFAIELRSSFAQAQQRSFGHNKR